MHTGHTLFIAWSLFQQQRCNTIIRCHDRLLIITHDGFVGRFHIKRAERHEEGDFKESLFNIYLRRADVNLNTPSLRWVLHAPPNTTLSPGTVPKCKQTRLYAALTHIDGMPLSKRSFGWKCAISRRSSRRGRIPQFIAHSISSHALALLPQITTSPRLPRRNGPRRICFNNTL